MLKNRKFITIGYSFTIAIFVYMKNPIMKNENNIGANTFKTFNFFMTNSTNLKPR